MKKTVSNEKQYDFSDFKVKDLAGRTVIFEEDSQDPVKVIANNLYMLVGDIALLRKVTQLYDEKIIILTKEEKERIIQLLESNSVPVNALVKFQFIKYLNQ